jgi:hypothetical protein
MGSAAGAPPAPIVATTAVIAARVSIKVTRRNTVSSLLSKGGPSTPHYNQRLKYELVE